MNPGHIRYQQFAKALIMLEQAAAVPNPSDLELEGMVQRFEYTFELAWKTLKDELRTQGVDAASPREVIKSAHKIGWLEYGEKWIDMPEQRNLMSHTYDEENFRKAVDLIKNHYIDLFVQLNQKFKSQPDA